MSPRNLGWGEWRFNFCVGHYIRLANRSETALLVENAMTIFDSRLFPVTPSIFPVRRQIIPDYALTGIPGQAVDASALFSRPNGRPKAKSTKFPVIFPVHGNFPFIHITPLPWAPDQSDPNQSIDWPCGPVQASGLPFNANRKLPGVGAGGALSAEDGNTDGASLLIQIALMRRTVSANRSRAARGAT